MAEKKLEAKLRYRAGEGEKDDKGSSDRKRMRRGEKRNGARKEEQ